MAESRRPPRLAAVARRQIYHHVEYHYFRFVSCRAPVLPHAQSGIKPQNHHRRQPGVALAQEEPVVLNLWPQVFVALGVAVAAPVEGEEVRGTVVASVAAAAAVVAPEAVELVTVAPSVAVELAASPLIAEAEQGVGVELETVVEPVDGVAAEAVAAVGVQAVWPPPVSG
jgi:molybdenum cofactor biosynthesis enzyme